MVMYENYRKQNLYRNISFAREEYDSLMEFLRDLCDVFSLFLNLEIEYLETEGKESK